MSSYQPVPTSESNASQPERATSKRPRRTHLLVALLCAVVFVLLYLVAWPHTRTSPTMSYGGKYSIG
jgi:hypothetical protein